MHKKLKFTALLFTCCILISATAQADPITIPWTDTVNIWTGYGGPWGTAAENSMDVVGGPSISGGYVTVDGGFILTIAFHYTDWAYPDKIKPGDLFLDMNNDGLWDYVMAFNGAGLYEVSSNSYLITGPDGTGDWVGWDIRNNHPYAYDPDEFGALLGTGTIEGLPGSGAASGTLIFNLPAGALPYSSFTFGWTQNCANDVVLQRVPEPGTLALLGLGLLGIAVAVRRRR
jgi:hypothetical protein